VGSLETAEKPKKLLAPFVAAPPAAWQNESIACFYTEYVAPFSKTLCQLGLLGVVIKILQILEIRGDAPSVCEHDQTDRKRWDERFRLLAKISVRRHSLNVAAELMCTRQKRDPEFAGLSGRLLVAGLGHDLGKIPYYRGKERDHQTASRNILADIIPAGHPSRREILEAIWNHHYARKGSNPIADRLRQADQQARSKELAMLRAVKAKSGTMIAVEKNPEQTKSRGLDLSWLTANELLDAVAAQINVVDAKGGYAGFSCPRSGLAYIQVEALYQSVVALAMQTDHPEVMAYGGLQGQKNALLLQVRTLLGKAVSDKIGKSFIGQKYRIVTTESRKLNPGLYLPIKIEAFKTPVWEFEARKKGPTYTHRLLQSIKYVEVFRGKER
jgi:hypothetical protein